MSLLWSTSSFLLPSLISPCKNIAVSQNPNHKCGATLVCQTEKQTQTPVFNLQKSGLVEHLIVCSRSDLREKNEIAQAESGRLSVFIIINRLIIFELFIHV